MRIQDSMDSKIVIYHKNWIHKVYPIKVLISSHVIRIRNKSMRIFIDIPRHRKRENSRWT